MVLIAMRGNSRKESMYQSVLAMVSIITSTGGGRGCLYATTQVRTEILST